MGPTREDAEPPRCRPGSGLVASSSVLCTPREPMIPASRQSSLITRLRPVFTRVGHCVSRASMGRRGYGDHTCPTVRHDNRTWAWGVLLSLESPPVAPGPCPARRDPSSCPTAPARRHLDPAFGRLGCRRGPINSRTELRRWVEEMPISPPASAYLGYRPVPLPGTLLMVGALLTPTAVSTLLKGCKMSGPGSCSRPIFSVRNPKVTLDSKARSHCHCPTSLSGFPSVNNTKVEVL